MGLIDSIKKFFGTKDEEVTANETEETSVEENANAEEVVNETEAIEAESVDENDEENVMN